MYTAYETKLVTKKLHNTTNATYNVTPSAGKHVEHNTTNIINTHILHINPYT